MVETKCARGLQSWWSSLLFGECGICVEVLKKRKERNYKIAEKSGSYAKQVS